MVLPPPTPLTQPNDWSCGVYALRTLLRAQGYPLRPTEKKLGTTRELGTSHVAIVDYLKSNGVRYCEYSGKPVRSLMVPCLVNYQSSRDGHYAVLWSAVKRLTLLNPGNGRADSLRLEDFNKRWFSTRYGSQWALYIYPL